MAPIINFEGYGRDLHSVLVEVERRVYLHGWWADWVHLWWASSVRVHHLKWPSEWIVLLSCDSQPRKIFLINKLNFLFFLQIKHLHKECEFEVILRGMNRMVLRSSSGMGKYFPLRRGNNEPKGGRAWGSKRTADSSVGLMSGVYWLFFTSHCVQEIQRWIS